MFDATILKHIREEKNVSLSQLSMATGISKSSLQRYETGTTNKLPLEAVSLIEKTLGLKQGFLMGCDTSFPELSCKKKEFIKQIEKMTDVQVDRLEQIWSLVENKE